MGALDSLILVMMYAIVLSVFFQQSTTRKIVAVTFSIAIILHDRLFYALSDDSLLYYITAAIFDLLVILIISQMNSRSRLSTDIQAISVVSIVFNLIGWAQYLNGHDGSAYTAMYLGLYGLAIVALFRREPVGNGKHKSNTLGHPIRAHAHSGHLFGHSEPSKK